MPAVKEKTSRPKSSPPSALVGKLSFGAITKKKEGAKTVYPRDYFECLGRHQVTHVFNSWEAMPTVAE